MAPVQYVIGIDFGTDSVRSIIIDAADGCEIASEVADYPRWKEGRYCDPARNQFRQHPLDFIESMETSIRAAILKAPRSTADRIVGIGMDTTGSTPAAVDQKGTPLAMTPGFKENPNAMFVLWKDHTAVEEAAEINHRAKTWGGEDFTKYEGGIYSSEWFWSKILHIVRRDQKIQKAAFSWLEHCDWIGALLTGHTDPLTLKRSRCAAGHKAMWHTSWNGLPSEDFLSRLDPRLTGLRERLYTDTFTSDVPAGTLCAEWASRLGLRKDVRIAVGAFDAHLGAVGAEIKPYTLCKVMGTSTCDMLIAPMYEMGDRLVRGICGQVEGSIIPGMLGMEAGQSAFGDIYAWFRDILMWPLRNMTENVPEIRIQELAEHIIPELSRAAEKLPVHADGTLALDWMNGRRTPDADQRLKGVIAGLNLGSDAVKIFKALVESTAFGAKKIVDRFISEGVPIHGIIGLGGVAKKADYVMQVVTDVLNMPMRIARSEQTVALGSGMAAATASGIYRDITEAQEAMGNGFEKEYRPEPEKARVYQILYKRYSLLGDFIENKRM